MPSNPRTLMISLARGGSARIPRKNLCEVGGVPLVGRAVRTARIAAGRLGGTVRIVVSTDDAEVGRVARQWGAETPFVRPASLAAAEATSVDALRHAVDFFAARGETFTEIVLIQPTTPLCLADDVVRAVSQFRRNPRRSVVSVRPGGPSDSIRFLLGPDNLVVGQPRPEDRGAPVELNGAVYVFSPTWLDRHDRLCVPGATVAITMPPERSVDVDTALDLKVARCIQRDREPWSANRCFIIAEAGVNHDGSLDSARQLIDAACEAGADAVKFQTFKAGRLARPGAPKAAYQAARTPGDDSQYRMLERLELSRDDHLNLLGHCERRGIKFLSSAFGEEDVALLDELGVEALKIGSAEITNTPLLRAAGASGRPVILSTGGSHLREVAQAVEELESSGCFSLALLHCVSSYPAPPAACNLRAIKTLARAFGVPVGFSDHTTGLEIPTAAVALGARILEKHLTLDRSRTGPDHAASLEPDGFAALVDAVRHVESAMGDGRKRPTECEYDVRFAARRSLVAATELRAGTVVRALHVTSKRPGDGISPVRIRDLLGRRLLRDLAPDEPFEWRHLEPVEVEH